MSNRQLQTCHLINNPEQPSWPSFCLELSFSSTGNGAISAYSHTIFATCKSPTNTMTRTLRVQMGESKRSRRFGTCTHPKVLVVDVSESFSCFSSGHRSFACVGQPVKGNLPVGGPVCRKAFAGGVAPRQLTTPRQAATFYNAARAV